MIRSSIGIVCVLVLITTCAQSTAAQAHGEYSLSALRGGAMQSRLSCWIELADQGISDRILSSDAYHDKFRFRAAPVKQSRNWKMPIVDVRPAKDISVAFNQPQKRRPAVTKTEDPLSTNSAPVFNWVWESSDDLAVRYCELDDPLDQVAPSFIPRPLPPRKNQSHVKLLKLKLAKVTPEKKKPSQQKRPMTTGRKDYWNYYGDCDRWGVVFAIPAKRSPAKLEESQQVAEARQVDRRKSEIAQGLQELAALIAHRWEKAMSFYKTVSKRLLASRS